jgi:hypothetical protein
MELQVFRPKQFSDMARDYKLFADGKEVAIIKRGETAVVFIPEKTAMLQAKIDWCSSPMFPISAITSGKITVKNSFSGNVLKSSLMPLYYVSFGRKKYLQIENGISE